MATTKLNLGRQQTQGAAVTTATPPNAGDSAFNVISKGAGAPTLIWDGTHLAHDGSSEMSMLITPASGYPAAVVYNGFNTLGGSAQFYFRTDVAPSTWAAGFTPCAILNTNSGAMSKLNFFNNGRISVTDNAGATIVNPAGVLVANTRYRVEMYAAAGAAGAGTIDLGIFLDDSTSRVANLSLAAPVTTATTGTSFFGSTQYGKYDGGTMASPVWIMRPAAFDSATTLPGPPAAAGTAPTAAFTPKINGLAVAVDGTASAVTAQGATITGYSWNWGDSTANGTGATASHTYTTAGKYTQTLTVTDSNGSTGTATTRVVVAAASGTVLPGYTQPGTGNVIVPGAAGGTPTAQEVLTDASTDSWLEGPTGSFTQDIPIGASLVLNAGQSEVWDCTFGVYDKSGQGIAPASPSVVTAELREGTPGLSGGSDTSQLRSSLSGLTAPFETSATVGAHVAVEFPSADLATITDPTKVFLRLKGTVS